MIGQEETVRIRRLSSKKAIDLAMEGRWREAVDANRSLIESFADDVDAHNRLGRAHMELGEYEEAREAYNQALRIDPHNMIARKNNQRLKLLSGSGAAEDSFHRVDPHSFIEETGKAGVVSLYRLAPPAILAGIVAGDALELRVRKNNLLVQSGRGEYVGMVSPKHAKRLMRLMSGGNRYGASVVSVNEHAVSVIIREEYQHPDQVGLPSFPSRGFERIRSYSGDRPIRREFEDEEERNEEEPFAGEEMEQEEDSSESDEKDSEI